MRRMVKYAVAALTLVAATSGQAQAQTVRLTAVISGAHQKPGGRAGATGTAEGFVDPATPTGPAAPPPVTSTSVDPAWPAPSWSTWRPR